jgi:hypothetical protein
VARSILGGLHHEYGWEKLAARSSGGFFGVQGLPKKNLVIGE